MEGLSLRLAFLSKVLEHHLCNVDTYYLEKTGKPVATGSIGETLRWTDFYIDFIAQDLSNHVQEYAKVLSGCPRPSRDIRFDPHVEKKKLIDQYENQYYDKIFADCGNCPARDFCFCMFKTFLVCAFTGSLWKEQNGPINRFLSIRIEKLEDRPLLSDLLERWLCSNIVEKTLPNMSVKGLGFPYLIRSALETKAVQDKHFAASVISSPDWENGKYVGLDAYITASLLPLLSNEEFTSRFAFDPLLTWTKGSRNYERVIQTLAALQVQDPETKSYLYPPPRTLRIGDIAALGSWQEGFWGARPVVRVKSTCDIARMLFESEGQILPPIARALEFVVRAFMATHGSFDEEGGQYVIDDNPLRGIELCSVSNISGTIGALRFLLSIVNKIDDIEDLDHDVKAFIGDAEKFVSVRIEWLVRQQNVDGSFPMVSTRFVRNLKKNWGKSWQWAKIEDPSSKKNSSLNNTIDAIFLLIDYLDTFGALEPAAAVLSTAWDATKTISACLAPAYSPPSDPTRPIEILLVDPYVDDRLLTRYFEEVDPSNSIRILTRVMKDKFRDLATKFVGVKPFFEVRRTEAIHGRYLFVGDRSWVIDSSVDLLAEKRLAFIIELSRGAASRLRRNVNTIWSEAERIVESKPPKKFVSVAVFYWHQDKAFVERLAKDLKERDVAVWYDISGIKVGDSIPEKINEVIRESGGGKGRYLCFLLTPESVQSAWGRLELSAALLKELSDRSVTLLPLLLRECDIPPLIADKRYADFRGAYEDGLKALLEALGC